MFEKIRNEIEGKRNSENIFWKILVSLKDFFWRISVLVNSFRQRRKLISQFIYSEDAARIRKLKNKYLGKRIFIIGGGPSLNKTNLSLLKNEYTFAVNNFIPNGIKKFKIEPFFYAMSDGRVMYKTIKSFSKNIPKHTLCFFPLEKRKKVTSYIKENLDNVYYINDTDRIPKYKVRDNYFSIRADKITYLGESVIIDYCLPLAIYMGFKNIYLVGCDHTHEKGFHFDGTPPVRKFIVKWNRISKAFATVKNFCDKHNINIKNATVGGELEVFERVKLEEVFKGKAQSF
jgi:hypothetical protein